MVGEVVAKPLHLLLFRAREPLSNKVGRGMKADEVDAAGEVAKQAQQFVGMADSVVLPMPADVFKTDTALVRPVVLFKESDYL